MIWDSKIEHGDYFYHKGRDLIFMCYGSNDEYIYPSDSDSRSWLTYFSGLTFVCSDCVKLHDIFRDYSNLETKSLTVFTKFYEL